ncbi:MAG: SpvB/TcaC N-terminal domain-containing protein, partial [Anaerolineaceae bacterium]|nr:SpvB/TcaC N-terminal domain-containing protein [Anaerolineaceae bacterium]
MQRILTAFVLLVFCATSLAAVVVQAAPPAASPHLQILDPSGTPNPGTPPAGEATASPSSTPTVTETTTALPSATPTATPTLPETASPTSTPTQSLEPTATLAPLPDFNLTLTADAEAILPGEALTLRWAMAGAIDSARLKDLRLVFQVPPGFIPENESQGVFDPDQATFEIKAKEQGKVEWIAPEELEGEPRFNLRLVQGEDTLAEAELTLPVEGTSLIGLDGGEVSGLGGKVKVKVPAGALPEAVEVSVRKAKPDATIPRQVNWQPVELRAKGTSSRQAVHQFQDKVEIEMSYDEALIDGDPTTLTWFSWDPETGWNALPSEVDPQNHTVKGWTDHFSLFNLNTQYWLSAKLPPLDAAQVAPFTGAATYSYPIEVPPGQGGLTPSVSLSYNSNVIDGVTNQTQSSWVGMGWELAAGGMIRRDMHKTQNWDGDDTFSLVMGGVGYDLAPVAHYPTSGATQDIDYKTTSDTFWLIRRYVSRAAIGTDYNREYDNWEVWDKLGNRYTFSTRAYYLEYYDNAHEIMRVWGWFLTSMTNGAGQALRYYYDMDERSEHYFTGDNAWVEMAVYLKDIVYPDNHTRIRFAKEVNRSDYDPAWDGENAMYFYVLHERSRLGKIQILHDPDFSLVSNTYSQYSGGSGYQMVDEAQGNSTIVREYQLNYFADTDAGGIFRSAQFSTTHSGKILTLQSVVEYGKHNSHNQANSVFVTDTHTAASSLPTTSFAYGDGIHLSQVSNGQGGVISFTYDTTPFSASEGKEYQAKGGFAYPTGRVGTGWTLIDDFTTFRPGAAYKISCDFGWWTADHTPGKVRYVFQYNKDDWSQVNTSVDLDVVGIPNDLMRAEEIVLLQREASQLRANVQKISGGDLGIEECKFYPLLTRYRVTQKIINTGFASSTYTYTYSGAAVNDAAHSTKAANVINN